MRGEYQHNIDAKGRMIFPVRLREELGEHAVIFRGLDHCLTVFPAEKWAKLQEKLESEVRQLSGIEATLQFIKGVNHPGELAAEGGLRGVNEGFPPRKKQ